MPYVKPSSLPKPERRAYPSDLSDAEWAVLEPLLPVKRTRGQPRIHSYREIVNGILYVLRNGIAWDAMPHDLPPKGTVHDYFRDWMIDGTWKRVHDTLFAADRRRAGTPGPASLAGSSLHPRCSGSSVRPLSCRTERAPTSMAPG